jgi:hypothetical protein
MLRHGGTNRYSLRSPRSLRRFGVVTMKTLRSHVLLVSLVGCPLAMALTGCSRKEAAGPLPNDALVARLEARLAQNQCIGSLERWQRTYDFPLREGRPDTSRIIIALYEAGKYGRAAGRLVLPPGGSHEIDERPMLYASATYEVAGDRLVLHSCGYYSGS